MAYFKSFKEFIPIHNELKNSSKSIVFTNGVFDILHRGHLEYLNEAKKFGDILIIGLNSDSSVKRIKGEARPVNNENDRAYLLSELKPVDHVIIFEDDTPYELIKCIMPNTLVKGGDWKEENIIGSDIVKQSGGKVYSLKYVDNFSTTNIINKLKKS